MCKNLCVTVYYNGAGLEIETTTKIKCAHMKILFKSPENLNKEREKEFLGKLSALPAYVGNEGMGAHFLLELNSETVEFESIRQLSVLFQQWKIDPSPLESLYELMGIKAPQFH